MKIRYLIIFCVFLSIIALVFYRHSQGVTVSVANKNSGVVKNVVIIVDGKSIGNPKLYLNSEESFELRINPKVANLITVEYDDEYGFKWSRQIDAYMEKNYSGKIQFDLYKSGKIVVKNEIRSTFL